MDNRLQSLLLATGLSLAGLAAPAFPASGAVVDPEVDFVLSSSMAVEGGAAVTVGVQLSQVATADVTVPYTVTGSADALDASVPAGPLVILAGQSSGSFDIQMLDDADSEGLERVVVTLGTPTNGTLGSLTEHTVLIDDDEAPATIAFDLATGTASEGDGMVNVALTLSAARTEDAEVSFGESGSALAGVDASVAPASSLVIPAGMTTGVLAVALVQDGLDESDEDYVLTLVSAQNCDLGAVAQHTLTISDDDDEPTVGFAAASTPLVENGATVSLSVELSAASSFPITVDVVASGDAVDGSDYTFGPATISIPAGDTTGTIDVTPLDDSAGEGTETATFTLVSPTSATLGAAVSHDVILIDDDNALPEVDFSAAMGAVDEDAGVVSVTVQASDYGAASIQVPVTATGTATDGADFNLVTTSLVIPVGALSATVDVEILDDMDLEGAETIDLALGTPVGAVLGVQTTHALEITDNDATPVLSFALAASAFAEADGTVLVDLVLDRPATGDVTIPFTLGGTAVTGGVDVDVLEDPLVIVAGATSGQVSIAITPDDLHEGDETLVLGLGAVTGADLGSEVLHTLTLQDDDAQPTVAFESYRSVVRELDGGFSLRVELDVPSGLDVSVPFTVSGDASGPGDATLPPSPAVIPAGATHVDLPVALVVDRVPELGEKILFTMSAPTGATLGGTTTHITLIQDGEFTGLQALPKPLTPSVTEMTFAETRVAEFTASQALHFTNLDSVPVTLTEVVRRGAMKGDFQLAFPVPLPITLAPGASAQVDVTFSPVARGVRTLRLLGVKQSAGSPPIPIELSGFAYGPTGAEIAMDANDEPYDAPGRDDWTAEYGHTGGDPGLTAIPVAGTDLDPLYHNFRIGSAFDYALTLPNGAYEVRIHSWEPVLNATGVRVFDVLLEGSVALDDLDVFAEVGQATAYVSPALPVTIADGMLDISIQASVGRALLCALEVRSVPVISTTPTQLGFGIVDQGTSATQVVQFQNDGLHPGTIDKVTFTQGPLGESSDFTVTIGGVDFAGAAGTITHPVMLSLPPGQTDVPVTFTPTEHVDHQFTIDFESSATSALYSVDADGTGGAEAGWGFLHPVPDSFPTFVVDYDGDGMETVKLLGAESHTHEPGHALLTHDWEAGGVPIASQVDTTHDFAVGTTSVSLTIGDDNVPATTATDDRLITVHPVDRVPGPLVLYYDAAGGNEIALLDNVPQQFDFAERTSNLVVNAQEGKVGASPFTESVMVQWVAEFDLMSPRTLVFSVTGGADQRLFVNGVAASGAQALSAGSHSVEVRFAVSSLADLPLSLIVLEGGVRAVDIEAGLVHDEQLVPPVIHAMPTVGTDLGGNRIEIDGFGFFPEDQTVVHWGNVDIPYTQFDEWLGEQVVVFSPPGTGTINVSVETPNGVSNVFQFDYSPSGPIPVRFDLLSSKEASITDVTAAAWAPDGRLFVSVLDGTLRALTYDETYTITSIEFFGGVSGLTNHDTIGIAFNPFDVYDPQDPSSLKVYISHGEQFQNGGGAFTGPSYFTGQISLLSGPTFDSPVPLATGLPVSNHDHSVAGMDFDDNGDMLLCVGGNTNAGVTWPLIGDVPESPLSGAIVKLKLSDPAFNGVVLYQDSNTGVLVDDQVYGEQIDLMPGIDIEVHASGMRHAYDFVMHTNGYVYATDNGPNNPYGPESFDAATEGALPHPTADDELNLIEPGLYYGSANRSRGRYEAAQNTYYDPFAASIPGVYRRPMTTLASSTNGLEEYRSNAFNGAMRGELIAMKWNSGIYRLGLRSDGRAVTSKTLYSSTSSTFPKNQGLDVVSGPGGALIAIDYTSDAVRVQVPDDISAIGVTPYDIFPWRAPALGGQPFVIGGLGFGTDAAVVSVTIGGVAATVDTVSDGRITGVIPPSATGLATDLLDVTVQVGSIARTITEAFRYLPATPGQGVGRWRDTSGLPLALGEVAAAVVGEYVYLFGQGDARTFRHSFAQGNWSLSLAQRPFPGNHHGCEVVDGKIYLIGGLDSGSAGKVQIYDPTLDVWTMGATMPWNGGSCVTALIGGKIYVGGGNLQGAGTASNFAVYDPTLDTWTALGTMPVPVNHAASGTDGERLFVFGGRQGMNVPQAGFSDVQIYDPVAGSWSTSAAGQVAAMPLPRGGTGRAIFAGGEFYIMGGEDATNAYAEVQAYDPVADTWRMDRPMPTPRHGMFPVLFESRIFVHGGGLVAGFGMSTVGEVLSPR